MDKTPGPNSVPVWRKLALYCALLFIAYGLYVLCQGFFGGYEGNARIQVFLSAGILLVGPGIVAAFQVLLWKRPDKYRPQTGREIWGEFCVSALGLAFVIPFFFVSTDGQMMPLRAGLVTTGLAFLSIAFPLIRARKIANEAEPATALADEKDSAATKPISGK
ncbi:hypothetical protein ACT3UD_17595 [Glutamicibacter sp. 287]|uniref:hypothetical protein n=1 Tax=unclassified Glutamicibacter TaxID=2627139 RepID=UPI000BB7F1CA|nr:hypothetical protein [Glutamicibacter sp. BW80]